MESFGNAAPDTAALACAFGEYVLLREIGRGAMGVVYEARQPGLGRTVALKMLAAGRFASEADARRLVGEARAAAQLEHPGIVRVHEAGICEGRHYFTMELVQGHSLAEEVVNGPLEPRRAARVLAEVAEAIQYAHERGVVHRDLKPSNVLVGADGRPRITDFGLAKLLDADSSSTQSGEPLGTPAYMAPEQAAGEAKHAGPAADVYGLGALLYTLLSGRPLFLSPTALGTLKQVQEREPIPLRVLSPAVPKDLETICHACLHKAPERRIASAGALAADLERFLAGKAIEARPVTRLERLFLYARRRPGATALALALAILTVGGVTTITWQWRESVATVALLRRAERENLRTRLAALAASGPETFAFLADRLDPSDPTVALELQRACDSPSWGARSKLRARWVLAAVLPELLEGALEALAEHGEDPREIALAVIALRRIAPRVPRDAWERFLSELAKAATRGDDATPRLLAATLLCALDPAREGWRDAREALARHLARTDPYSLPAWEGALEPFPPELLDALAAIYSSGESEAERLQVARILERRGRSAPELLLRLLPRSDERQYVALMPAVLEQRELAAERMRTLLAAPATLDWNDGPLPPLDPDTEAVQIIEASGGLVAERFALAPDLGADDVLHAVVALREAGFRPVRARPRIDEGELRLAAVWCRDEADFDLAFDVAESELAPWERGARERGLAPCELAAWFVPGESSARFLALAGALASGAGDAAFLHGPLDVAGSFTPELVGAHDALARREFRPDALQIARAPGGSALACSVWLRLPRVHEFFLPPAIPPEVFAREPFPLACQMDVAAWSDPGPGGAPLAFAGVWYPDPARESRTLAFDSIEAHQSACAELAAGGWRPRALAAARPSARAALSIVSVWQRPIPVPAERFERARERALAAASLLHLGTGEDVWPAFAGDGDRDVRAHLVVNLGTLGIDPALPLRRLEVERDAAARRALVLALGSYAPAAFAEPLRGNAVELVRRLFREDPDPGLHSACGWTLGAWGEPADPPPAPPREARWFETPSGLSMIALPGPSELVMGSPGSELGREPGETSHRRRIPRSFALATKETTGDELAAFFDAVPELAPGFRGEPDAPVLTLSWYQAVGYCRWLSEREGIAEEEMCYPPLEHIGPGMELFPDALERTGYRLPTEGEWEYACRAGSRGSYSFGSDPALLPAFGHSRASALGAPAPVGRLRPNDFGFFDLHGNVMEWCHDPLEDYQVRADGLPTEDGEHAAADPQWRVIRGGSFDDLAGVLRCAQRKRSAPGASPRGAGLRVARTLR